MIRVLHVLGGLERGGAETMVMNLYRKIDKSEIQFDFIVHTETKDAYYEEIISLGGKIYHCPKYKGKNHFAYKKWWKTFFQSHPEYRIVHGHVRSTASIYLKIARSEGLYAIAHSHSTSSGTGLSAFIKNCFQYRIRYNADFYMGCSYEANCWLFGKKVAKDATKCIVFKNAINTEIFRFSPEIRKKIRDQLQVSTDCLLIGSVGRLTIPKNPTFIVQICKCIYELNLKAKKYSSVKMIWLGTGKLYDEIISLIKEESLSDVIELLGSRSDVNEIMQAMDAFILPSLWEGLGIVAIEAQAAGLPTFCSDVIPCEVSVSELCSFLPLGDPNIWADRILNADLTRKDCSKEIVEAGYDIKSTVQWLSEFYKKIKN